MKVDARRKWRANQLLLLLLVPLTIAMVRNSLGFVLRPSDPALAIRFDPDNAEVAASRAEQLVRSAPTATNLKIAEGLAQRALARSPVSAAGARMLATVRDAQGDRAGAMRLVRYSETLSRRDLPTEMYLIDAALAHNDIRTALAHYDIALRTSEISRALLFPVLIAATSHREVTSALQPILAARPLWADAFLTEASQKAPNLDELGDLLTGLAHVGYPVPEPILATAIGRMIDVGDYAAAQRLYASRHSDFRAAALRDGTFSAFGSARTAFDWQPLNPDGILAEPVRDNGSGALEIRARDGSGGIVARQLLTLPSGMYRLGVSVDRSVGNGAAKLSLSCASGREVLAELGDPANGSGRIQRVIAVPDRCPAQWLELTVDSGDDPAGLTEKIGPVRLSRVAPDRAPIGAHL